MIEGQEGVSWEQWLALARTAEEAGIDALFRSDHYLSFWRPHANVLDAWATVTALAASTRTIRLGTLVSPVTFRTAGSLAKVVASADQISGGRVELGIGAGWNEDEHAAHGLPFPPLSERFRLLEETLDEIVRQWAELPPAPVQQPRPPIVMGGRAGPRGLRLAASRADEYNCAFVTAERCREVRGLLDDAGGAHVRLSAMVPCVVGADDAEAEARRQAIVGTIARELPPATLVGGADAVASSLREYAEAGVTCVYVQHLLHEDLESVRLIGRELVPVLA